MDRRTLEEALADRTGVLPYSTMLNELAKRYGQTASSLREAELRSYDISLLFLVVCWKKRKGQG